MAADVDAMLERAVAKGWISSAVCDDLTDSIALGRQSEADVAETVGAYIEAARMRPAHEFMMRQNGEKVVRRARELLASSTSPEPLVKSILEHLVEREGSPIINSEEIHEGSYAGKVLMGTVGMTLLGKPEVLLKWPVKHTEAAQGVMEDIVAGVMQNDHQPIVHGRKVLAHRYELAYAMVDATSVIGDLGKLWTAFPAATRRYRPNDSKECAVVVLHWIAHLAEDCVLSGGPQGTVAVWRQKGGRDVFTGIVKWPVPSQSWRDAGFPGSMARLVDPEGDLMGPCRILTPQEFVEAMAEYDP